MTNQSRLNNFDLIRLVAALSVVLYHSTKHLHLDFGLLGDVALGYYRLFPGVPVFFVVSGYLVSASYLRSTSVSSYARKRALRILPALWLVTVCSLLMVAAFGFVTWQIVTTPRFVAWLAGQLTIMPLYNPPFLRDFGVGALNGSLWTIPVEIGFYVAVPVIFGLANRLQLRGRSLDLLLGALILASFGFNLWIIGHPDNHSSVAMKLLKFSTLSHLYMFLFGVLLQLHQSWVRAALVGKAVPWLAAYLIYAWGGHALGMTHAAVFDLLGQMLLAHCVIAVAFTAPSVSHRLLRENDISYGVYLFHMPIVNAVLHLGYSGDRWLLVWPVVGSMICASLSWVHVEKPALALKPGRTVEPSPSAQ